MKYQQPFFSLSLRVISAVLNYIYPLLDTIFFDLFFSFFSLCFQRVKYLLFVFLFAFILTHVNIYDIWCGVCLNGEKLFSVKNPQLFVDVFMCVRIELIIFRALLTLLPTPFCSIFPCICCCWMLNHRLKRKFHSK